MVARHGGEPRETFRRVLREKGPIDLKTHASKKHEGEIMTIAKSPVVTMSPTTPVYDAIKIMVNEGFRRMPLVDPGTKKLRGTVTASDIINYLGGGEKFQIIQKKYAGNFFKAINEPIKSLMTPRALSMSTTAKISDAIDIMRKHNVGGLPVVDERGHVWAIVTEKDIITLFSGKIREAKVANLMSRNLITASSEVSIREAEKIMIKRGFRRLPIISNSEFIGMATVRSILRFFGSGEVFKHLQSGTINQVLQTSVLEVTMKNVATIEPDADIGKAAKTMQEKNVGSLPVVKDGKLVGIITERDFFKLIIG
ncbi:MAG: CBS domain-containing protein [Candidatus Bathyarchaeota archaeon]|nr:CBS domain-containing protein [Candidatus Bathyarchaeota archaeon]MDH5732938.1 CBS domain-containing protein [Candidatus Bathyarchaeota archaeon]